MKTYSLLILYFILLIYTSGFSQSRKYTDKDFYDKISNHKLSFLKEKMTLDSEKESRFEILYMEFRDKRRNLKVDLAQNQLNLQKTDLTDKAAGEIIDNSFIIKQKLLDLEKEYYYKYAAILTEKEIAILYKSEEDYSKMMMERFKRGESN